MTRGRHRIGLKTGRAGGTREKCNPFCAFQWHYCHKSISHGLELTLFATYSRHGIKARSLSISVRGGTKLWNDRNSPLIRPLWRANAFFEIVKVQEDGEDLPATAPGNINLCTCHFSQHLSRWMGYAHARERFDRGVPGPCFLIWKWERRGLELRRESQIPGPTVGIGLRRPTVPGL